MLKKTTLLVAVVAALSVFAGPASASAAGTHWTDNHKVVSSPTNITGAFEGELGFALGTNAFECQVTVKVNVTGPTSSTINEFNVTTATCNGTGAFAKCSLKHDTNNAPWAIVNTDQTLIAGPMTTFYEYAQPFPECPLSPSSDLVFASGITLTPVLDIDSTIKELKVSGTMTNGAAAFGAFKPETPTLGLVTVS